MWGAENGYRLCNFGGAGKRDEEYGVRDFKAKFGGELICFARSTGSTTRLTFLLSGGGVKPGIVD